MKTEDSGEPSALPPPATSEIDVKYARLLASIDDARGRDMSPEECIEQDELDAMEAEVSPSALTIDRRQKDWLDKLTQAMRCRRYFIRRHQLIFHKRGEAPVAVHSGNVIDLLRETDVEIANTTKDTAREIVESWKLKSGIKCQIEWGDALQPYCLFELGTTLRLRGYYASNGQVVKLRTIKRKARLTPVSAEMLRTALSGSWIYLGETRSNPDALEAANAARKEAVAKDKSNRAAYADALKLATKERARLTKEYEVAKAERQKRLKKIEQLKREAEAVANSDTCGDPKREKRAENTVAAIEERIIRLDASLPDEPAEPKLPDLPVEPEWQAILPLRLTEEFSVMRFSTDEAAKILASQEVISKLQEIESFRTVRMPCWRDMDGKRTLGITHGGYDATTKTLTVEEAVWRKNMPLADAVALWKDLLSQFPFTGNRECGEAVIVGAALGYFGELLMPERSLFPGLASSANTVGAGKTTIVKLAMAPTEGLATPTAMPERREEMAKKIFSRQLSGSSMMFFDNSTKHLSSGALAMAMTSCGSADRVLGVHQDATADKSMKIVATGVDLTMDDELVRRFLSVKVKTTKERHQRQKFKHRLNDAAFSNGPLRGELCSALWAMISAWADAGCPLPDATVDSDYVEWANVGAAVTVHAGWPNPLLVDEESVDPEKEDVRTLFAACEVKQIMERQRVETVRRELGRDPVDKAKTRFYTVDLLEMCSKRGLLGFRLSEERNDKAAETRLGKLLKKWVDRECGNWMLRASDSRPRQFWVERIKGEAPVNFDGDEPANVVRIGQDRAA